MKQIFIAEIKTRNPFGWQSGFCFSDLMEKAIEHGDWISVHTNALWGGDFDSISFVRRNTNKPILAKGIHASDDDIKRAVDHGADYVLVVDRFSYCHGHIAKLIYEINEPKFSAETDKWSSIGHGHVSHLIYENNKFMCNSRDLRTGCVKENGGGLQAYLNAGVWVCQASGIRNIHEVNPRVNAYIVGEHLVNFCNVKKHHEKP